MSPQPHKDDDYTKRKCGVDCLPEWRFWNTLTQINNTPHLLLYIRTIYDETSDEMLFAVPLRQ